MAKFEIVTKGNERESLVFVGDTMAVVSLSSENTFYCPDCDCADDVSANNYFTPEQAEALAAALLAAARVARENKVQNEACQADNQNR